jgi:nitrate reductase alpha subunit
MKKLLIAAVAATLVFTACEKEKKNVAPAATETTTENATVDATVSAAKGTLNVEHVVATDKQTMFTQFNKDYRYFESQITLKNFMDGENASAEVAEINNVFQVVDIAEDQKSADVHVVMFNHVGDKTETTVINSFWVEDYALNDEAIKVTFEQAFDKMMKANIVKPHSRKCTLRKEIGPKEANPQWIFGNSRAQVYVDAVTGDVSAINPAFGQEIKLGAPLGEWP